MTRCYAVPEIQYVMDVIVIFHFGLYFLPFYLPNSPKNQNLKKKVKKKKTPGDIILQ